MLKKHDMRHKRSNKMKYEPSPRPIDCGGISADVNYVDAFTRADDPMHDGAHIHSFCEVYLNLSGDVSFVVEDSVYPVGRGDIIITKPNEVHRCVYHSDCVHEHFCLWFCPTARGAGCRTAFFTSKAERRISFQWITPTAKR